MAGEEWDRYLPDRREAPERDAFDDICAGQPAQVSGRRLRPEMLRVLCWDPGQLVKGRITLVGARVPGRLSLAGLQLRHGLLFRDCHFTDGVDLSEADCDDVIEFDRCEVGELTAGRLNTAKDVRITRCHLVRLSIAAADIGGDLVLSGSRLEASDQVAFDGRDLVVRGGVLLNDGFRADGKVAVPGSRIGNDLDCRNGHFRRPPEAVGVDPECVEPALDASSVIVGGELICSSGFRAEGEVRLQWARAHTVYFRGARLDNAAGKALRADGLHTAAGLYLDQQFQAVGTVRLVSARIGGELAATNGVFDNPGGVAIEANRLVAQEAYLDRGFRANGRVSLIGADLTRELNCTGGSFHNPDGTALDAIGLRCGGTAYLNDGFSADGQVRLTGVNLAGELNCTNGTFHSRDQFAIEATGLTTGGDVQLDGSFRATGGVRLRDASVAAVVDLSQARLSAYTDGTAFDAYGLNAGGGLVLRLAEHPGGGLDLSFATVGRLYDVPKSWPRPGHPIRLNGFTYRTLECRELGVRDRLDILRRMPEYHRQPYQQLSKVYREAGEERGSQDAAIEGLAEMRRRDKLPRSAKAWNWFLQTTVGYGYRIWRVFVLLLVIGLLNGVLYHLAEHRGLMVPTSSAAVAAQGGEQATASSRRCPDSYPCFIPYAYSFQLLIPVINLQQLSQWTPDARKGPGGLLLFYTWLMIVVGWAASAAVVGGLNNMLRKE